MSAHKLLLAATLVVALVRPALATEPLEYGPTASDDPTAATMVGDALIARPLYLAATAIGATVFLATLPFSVLGDNVDQAATALVTGPAHGLLTRCLGCARTVQDATVERPIE